jgi:hypothetical protein
LKTLLGFTFQWLFLIAIIAYLKAQGA